MPDVPGTGARGLFQFGAATQEAPAVPLPTEPEALQALEARGTALLLGILSRLQNLEGILRLERIERLSAEETVRTVVIDNEEAQALILELTAENSAIAEKLSTAVNARATLRETVNSVAVLASRALTAQPLLSQNESESALLVTRVRDDLAAALGIVIR